MLLALLLAGPLLAAAPMSTEQLQAAWDATEAVRVAPVARDAAGLSLTVGHVSYRFDAGELYPLAPAAAADPWAEALGFVFVGSGSLATGFADDAQAEAFAWHRLHSLGAPLDQVRQDLAAGTWTSPMTQGMVLSARPDLLDPARAQPALAAGQQADTAARLFEKRSELHEGGQDELRLVRVDQLAARHLGGDLSRGRAVVDVDTDVPLKLDRGARHGGTWVRDSWLTLVLDDSGTASDRNRAVLAAIAETEAGGGSVRTVSTELFPRAGGPEDTTSPPMASAWWEPVQADTTLRIDLAKGKVVALVDGHSRLDLAAAGAPASWLVVYVPFTDARKDTWELVSLTIEDAAGQPIPALALPAPSVSRWDERFSRSNNLVLLGRPIAPGEQITVDVQWKDAWRWQNLSYGPDIGMGTGSGLETAIPSVSPGLVGNPWRFSTRVGVPVDSEIGVALSGQTSREWEEEGLRWVEASRSDQPAMWGDVAIGKWIEGDARAPSDALPDLRLHVFQEEGPEALTGLAAETWKALSYYQQLLPPLPYPELDLFQAPDMWWGFVWIAPHAMVNMTQAKVFTGGRSFFADGAPRLSEGVLAHELAHQYWGHVARPGSIEDFWLAESFAELYSCLYLRAAYGEEAWTARMADYKETWEKDALGERASLTAAYESGWQPEIVYNYGPYVLGEMLRPRIGDQAFFGGLFNLLAAKPEQPMSTEELQLVLEAASGQDLGDFFDFWVRAGHIPAVTLEYEETADRRLVGTVSSSVPFGSFDLPVVARVGRQVVETWVTVRDGEGTLQSDPLPKGRIEVLLDPDGRILATSRKVKKR